MRDIGHRLEQCVQSADVASPDSRSFSLVGRVTHKRSFSKWNCFIDIRAVRPSAAELPSEQLTAAYIDGLSYAQLIATATRCCSAN